MNRFLQQLQRLNFDDGRHATSDGVRAMVIGCERAADWEKVAEVYRGLQADLELPAAAISVAGRSGYRIWLSLVEAVPLGEARRFLDALCRRYLADIPQGQLRCWPGGEEQGDWPELPPALDEISGKWSAFIDPSMGAMFVDESGLDMAPNMERQADMLSAVASIELADFRRALHRLAPVTERGDEPATALAATAPLRSTLDVGGNFSDPTSFLLAVMNDVSATADQRIEAAKALLPYFASPGRE